MTYGRSVLKALELFDIDARRWHMLAADRAAWRETLRSGIAPPAFRPPPLPPPLAQTRPARACIQATMAAIDATLREERRPFTDLTT